MKETTKMSRAICQLEKMYNTMNTDFYGGQLPTPIITIQSKPGTFGHCTVTKVWHRKEEQTYELNIAAEVLTYPIEETIDTMLHEMVHLYCRENGIQEVSRGGTYHNGKFKELAEKCGLQTFKTEKHGWNTKASDKLVEYALEKGWTELKLYREQKISFGLNIGIRQPATGTAQATRGRKSSTRKLQCPCCKNSVRATKEVNIICGDCMEKMIEV